VSALAVAEDRVGSEDAREDRLGVREAAEDRLGVREAGGDRLSAPVAGHQPARPSRTLEAVIISAWADLEAGLPAHCPLCDGELRPRYGAHSRPLGGRCARCQTTLE
jgi:hypothetical protein